MMKLKATWAPFPHEYSSCSSFKPKNFQWDKNEGIATVWIDRNILNYKGNKDKNYGWLCESSEILPDVKNHLIRNTESLKNHFIKIFTCDYEIINRDPNFFLFNPPGSNLPWTPIDNLRIPDKSKLCSMICSPKDVTSGHKLRLNVAKQLINEIDLSGGAHGTPRSGSGIGPNGDWWRSKEDSLSDYMFSIVFENASYTNYFTEKITDCFALGVIPIYWGSPNIGETFNEKGIIKWDTNFKISDLSKELYESKMEYIIDNLERVKSLESADDLIFNKISING